MGLTVAGVAKDGLNCTAWAAWLRNACQLTRATGPNGENELGLLLQKVALFFGLSRYVHIHIHTTALIHARPRDLFARACI